jgi:BirA family biotin operon repressor/biotin-[acetyl-CoA-carboxylase] ligase
VEHGRGTGIVLSAHPAAAKVLTVAETGSTNADLAVLARQGAADGMWLRAARQTAGRGRLGREWRSPVGNLYASTLIRLRASDPPAASLAFVAAVALESAVSVFAPGRVTLKWPNDLLVDGAKLSGILLERAGDAVVVGIGVNLAHHPDLADRPTTSMAAIGVPVGVDAFHEVLIDAFARTVASWRCAGFGPIRDAWLSRAHPLGTALAARLPDGGATEGLFDGLDDDGALMLRLAGGERRVIHAADIFLS